MYSLSLRIAALVHVFLLAILAAGLTSPTVAHAEGGALEASLDLQAGYSSISGNSSSQSINGKLALLLNSTNWEHEFEAKSLYSEADAEVASEKYEYKQKNRRLYDGSYVFFRLNYLRDLFSSYKYEASEVAGYGRYLIKEDALSLSLELGPGARQSQSEQGYENELVGYLSGKLKWKASESVSFSQSLELEVVRGNTIAESITTLDSGITERLSFQAEVDVRNDAYPPEGSRHTDVTTTLSLNLKLI